MPRHSFESKTRNLAEPPFSHRFKANTAYPRDFRSVFGGTRVLALPDCHRDGSSSQQRSRSMPKMREQYRPDKFVEPMPFSPTRIVQPIHGLHPALCAGPSPPSNFVLTAMDGGNAENAGAFFGQTKLSNQHSTYLLPHP